jgi:hypothetical protein
MNTPKFKKKTMKVHVIDKNKHINETDVRLVVCHSNIRLKRKNKKDPNRKEMKTVTVKPGYTFVFLTEVGFCYESTAEKYDVFKSEQGVIDLLSSNRKNIIFNTGYDAKGNLIQYKQFKAIYTEGMEMPDHEIEMASLIGDLSGIFSLPLPKNFTESPMQKKWQNLQEELGDINIERNLNPNEQNKIKEFVSTKQKIEKELGKMTHKYYAGTSVKTTEEFRKRKTLEMKRNHRDGEYKRAFRTLDKMMQPAPITNVTDTVKKQREFHTPPGIYIITGCRNIGFEAEPEVQRNGKRTRVNTKNNFNNNHVVKKAKKLNKIAKRNLRLESMKYLS